MTIIRVPTPLRPYTEGQKEIPVAGETVGLVVKDLTQRHPGLERHLFNDDGEIRPYVNIFLNGEDVRSLQGDRTPVEENDKLMIVPSIAGGMDTQSELPSVDHSALRTNQAAIITLLLIAFILNTTWLVALVAAIMVVGTILGKPGFLPVYHFLRRRNVLRPDIVADNQEPHRFAQGLGGAVLSAATLLFLLNLTTLGWVFSWIVVALAALNLFAGFCVGCAVYYWLNRLGIPTFHASPPEGRRPGSSRS